MQHRTDFLEFFATFLVLLVTALALPSVFGQQQQEDVGSSGSASFRKFIADVGERMTLNSGSHNAFIAIACLYGASFLNSCPKRGGFVWPALRRWRGWEALFGPEGYFQGEVRSEAGALDPHKLYIFCMFPHGSCKCMHRNAYPDVCAHIQMMMCIL
jgi:hypothetical protein